MEEKEVKLNSPETEETPVMAAQNEFDSFDDAAEREKEEQVAREKNAKMSAAPLKEERMTKAVKPAKKEDGESAKEESRDQSDDNKDEV